MNTEFSAESPAYCPSAQPEWKGSMVFGVVEGTVEEPRMTPLAEPVPVTVDLLKLARGVSPTEVYRFAAPCVQAGCAHFQSGRCHLAEKAVESLAPVISSLPECGIQAACRWFRQEGQTACLRCPQIVTDHPTVSPLLRKVADPGTAV